MGGTRSGAASARHIGRRHEKEKEEKVILSPFVMTMNSTTKNVLIAIVVIIVALVLARYTIFKDAIDEWGAGLERIGAWEDQYRRENPDATDEQVDAAFRAGIANIEVWKAQYKKDHPEATDAEVNAAFEAMWD